MDTAPTEVRSSRPTGPLHEAIAYASPADLVERLAPRIEDAVNAGDPVMTVLDQRVGEQLRDALGPDAGAVDFQDPREVYSVPGFTTAVRWARTARRLPTSGHRGLIIGQQLAGLPGRDSNYWTRLCIGLEVSMAGLPLTVLCPFPNHERGWNQVRRTHPTLSSAHGPVPNPEYRPPEQVVLDHPPPAWPDLGRPTYEMEFTVRSLRTLRHAVTDAATAGGLKPDRVAEAVLAVNELATNSVEHGPGHGCLRLWNADGMTAEVADTGRLDDPFPGMVQPAPNGTRGRGLWLASELSDVLETSTDNGTVIRVSWRP